MAARKAAGAKTPASAKKATAKKAAKQPRKSLAEAWAESYRPFTDAARERFAFLTREHGYAEPTVVVAPPDALVTFTKGADFVRVASEYGGPPWVTVKAGDAEPFGLHVIIAELDPAYAAKEPVVVGSILTADEMRARTGYLADFLEKHAAAALRGDPALLARLRARSAATRA